MLRRNIPEQTLRCCPKTSSNFLTKIAGNTFEDRSFSRKGFRTRRFLIYFPKSLIEYLQLTSSLLDKIHTETSPESCTLKHS